MQLAAKYSMRNMIVFRFALATSLLGLSLLAIPWATAAGPLPQPPAPACGDLGVIAIRPAIDSTVFCPEYLLPELPDSALAGLASIAYAAACGTPDTPDAWCGRLFFVQPDAGSVGWLGDFEPETGSYPLHTFAADLDLPTGLAYHAGTWLVAGDRTIYRLADADGDGRAERVDVLVDDLPGGVGRLTGSLGIGPDERLYVSKGAACATCTADPRRAAVLSYALDGSDPQVVATGLYDPFDFAWNPAGAALWLTARGPEGLGEALPLDALARLETAGTDFGWPDCLQGPDGLIPNPAHPAADPARCMAAAAATIAFPAHSHPAGLAWYHGAAFPAFEDDLLLVASGDWNQRLPVGYALYRVCFDSEGVLEPCLQPDGNPARLEPGLPSSVERLAPVYSVYPDQDVIQLQIQDQGFYPDHPLDVTISPEGWIVLSLQEGRILRLRPAPAG